MSFESFDAFEESQVKPRVEEIFDDVLNRPEEDRIVRAAFDFLTFFDAEREAQSDVLRIWIEDGQNSQPKRRTIFSAIGKIATGTFESIGRAYAGGSDREDQAKDPVDSPEIHSRKQEVASREETLEKSRMRIHSAKSLMPAIYNLTRRQVKQAEAIARNPQRLDRN